MTVPADPHLSARWDSDHSATVQWTQSGRACLSRQPISAPGVFIGCYDRQATITLTFGHEGPQDAAYAPMPGDIYILVTNGQTYRAPLIGRAQYLAVFRR